MHKGWLSRRPWMVATAVALLSLPGTAKAESHVELILDASGSMWGKAGSEEKITAAKHVVKEWLKDAKLSDDSHIGLTAYGHRDKDDCKDIEHFPAVAYGQRSTLVPIVDKLSPKGKTPIADSLHTVGESLKADEGATSILLVSDGIESCGHDPCAVAHELREQYGVNVTIHVVGFDVGDGRPQLECIAREGGGKYFNASDAAGLATAFEDVKAELVKADAATPPTPPPAPTTVEEVIEAGCSFQGGQIKGKLGSTHIVSCPAGCSEGLSIWGTDVYTGDSSICRAAIHAGLIDPQGGRVGVVLEKGRPAYRGSTQNEIRSSDYGAYGSSFRLVQPQ
jgi:LCCL domain-containing protein/VWA domain-containing protein